MSTLWHDAEYMQARAIGQLAHTNPFTPLRLQLEQQALGSRFTPHNLVWNVDSEAGGDNPNIAALNALALALAEQAREVLAKGGRARGAERDTYRSLVWYVLFYGVEDQFYRFIVSEGPKQRRIGFYKAFSERFGHYFNPLGEPSLSCSHLFALCYQHRRAFHFIFRSIFGRAGVAADLRAAVWQSIFTHDMQRYEHVLYERMHEVSTLICGPSGTGKELVARAIGWSRYIAFDVDGARFTEDFEASFFPLNLSALSPTLIEAELFGHAKGSFTGAVTARQGFLEGHQFSHTLFLDEIGELSATVQVKLLRVFQERVFQRIGEQRLRSCRGKIISATNRNLAQEISRGTFRADFYYRLCADVITTPPLCELIAGDPDELYNLIALQAQRIVGATIAEQVTAETFAAVKRELGMQYAWPGNMRELEQCVRNVVVRGSYRPLALPVESAVGGDVAHLDKFLEEFTSGRLSGEMVLRYYCSFHYLRLGSYQEVARQLQMDRRTVKRYVDPALWQQE